jgi:hypothetical protein
MGLFTYLFICLVTDSLYVFIGIHQIVSEMKHHTFGWTRLSILLSVGANNAKQEACIICIVPFSDLP